MPKTSPYKRKRQLGIYVRTIRTTAAVALTIYLQYNTDVKKATPLYKTKKSLRHRAQISDDKTNADAGSLSYGAKQARALSGINANRRFRRAERCTFFLETRNLDAGKEPKSKKGKKKKAYGTRCRSTTSFFIP